MPSAVASPKKMSGGGAARSPGVNRFGFHSSPRKFSSPKPPQRQAPESPNLTNIRKNLRPVVSSPSTGSTTSSRDLATPTKDVSTAKAAYLCVKSNVASDLETEEELATALQFCGFNPTVKTISEIRSKMGSRITFKDFEELVETKGSKFPAHASLMKAFRLLDPAGSGRISKNSLVELLTCRGQKLDQTVVTKYIGDARFQDPANPDLFNYIAFAEDVKKTSDQLVNQVKVLAAEAERDFAVNSKTYKVRRKSATSPKKPSIPAQSSTTEVHWKTTKSSKGAFFFEGESLISHQFNLEISTRQKVEIELESLDSSIDCQLYIFKVNEVVVNRNSESRYLLVERTPITTPFFSSKVSWCGYLDVGSYLLMPSTTGCRMKRRKHQPSPEVELVDILSSAEGTKPSVSLSSKFRQVLGEIFNQIDLDGSGGLSRQEFNLFNWRTSGEEVQDDEWRVVRENFDMVNGELTLNGFMQLHQMEAEDSSGDSAELWVTLNAMGYNYNLEQDEAALFRITTRAETEDPETMSLYVSGLRSGGPILDKATIRCVMENGTGEPQVVDKDITVFREDLGNCTSIVIQNKSSSTVALNMDFSHSQNVLINHPHLIFSTTLSAKSTLFVAHLIPDDPTLKHSVSLNVTLVNGR